MYFNRSGKKVRSVDARNWSQVIFNELNKPYNQQQLKLCREMIEGGCRGLRIDMVVYYPYGKFFTQTGEISARTLDETNWEKPLVDLIMLPKYYDRPCPYGVENLNIDDKIVTDVTSKKRPIMNEEHSIVVKLTPFDIKDEYKFFMDKLAYAKDDAGIDSED